VLLSQTLGLVFALCAVPSTVTIVEPGAPLSRLMPRLAQATGQPLAVSEALRKEVLCLDVHDAPVEELLRRIAQVTAGAWAASKDGLTYLQPSGAARARQHAEDIAFRTKVLTKALAAPPKTPTSKTPDDQEADSNLEPEVIALLRTIGPSELAAIADESRIVYSTSPTAAQVQLSDDAFATYAVLASAQNEKAERLKKLAASGKLSREQIDDAMLSQAVSLQPAKVLLIVSRQDAAGAPVALDVELRGYDEHGVATTLSSGVLGGLTQPSPEARDEAPIKLSPEAAKILTLERDLFQLRFDTSGRADLGKSVETEAARAEAVRLLFAPDRFDPTAFRGELVIGMAKARHLQLVALLPDSLGYFLQSIGEKECKPADVWAGISQSSDLAATQEGGWLTILPRNSPQVEARRVDRADLARVMCELAGDRYVTLDRVIELSRLGIVRDDDVANTWCVLARSPAAQALFEDWPFVELFRSFDDAQRAELSRSGRLGFRSLMPEQIALLSRLIYGPRDQSPNLEVADAQVAGPNSDSEGDTYRSEPTEVAPHGLPLDGYLTLTDRQDQVVIADQGKSTAPWGSVSFPLRTASFAARAARTLVPEWAPTAGFKVDRLSVGSRRTFMIQVYVAQGVYRRGSVYGFSFPEGPPVGISGLPKEIRDMIDAAVDRLRKRGPPPADTQGVPP